MSDRLRLVTRAADGTPTTIRDLENGTAYAKARGSFQVVAPSGKAIQAADIRQYGGAQTVGQTHENGALKWKCLVTGGTADVVIDNTEAMLADLLSDGFGHFIEWRPDGATDSVFYEVRGPASYGLAYEWAEFAGARVLPVEVQVPVAPLPEGERVVVASELDAGSPDPVQFPHVFQLPADMPGTAPGKMDVTVFTDITSNVMHWGLLSWWNRQGSPSASHYAPFGIHQTFADLATFGWTTDTDSESLTGTILKGTSTIPSGAEKVLNLQIDPTTTTPDEFGARWREIEVWVRLKVGNTTGKYMRAFLRPTAGGAVVHTREFGEAGRSLPVAATGHWRWFRLGTLPMPVIPGNDAYTLTTAFGNTNGADWAPAWVDAVMIVPARQRAMFPTGRTQPSTSVLPPYYGWQIGSGDQARRIASDLSSQVVHGAAFATSIPADLTPVGGPGGAPIVVDPGPVDVLVCVSEAIPEAPNIGTSSAGDDWPLAQGGIVVEMTGRHYAARGA